MKKVSPLCVFADKKDVTKESLYSTKVKKILLTHFLDEQIIEIQPTHVDLKTAMMWYS